MIWEVDYVVGNTYKRKRIEADSAAKAIKRARVKNIVDINPAQEYEPGSGQIESLVSSVSNSCNDPKVRRCVETSDAIRSELLKRCYARPGWDDLPLSEKNRIYDAERAALTERNPWNK